MSDHTSEYHHGEMDITEQLATFHDALTVTKWSCLVIAVGVLFFTLLFCTSSGFFGALFPAVILAAVGLVALKSRKPAH